MTRRGVLSDAPAKRRSAILADIDRASSPAMFASDQYELLDFGAGRKLERFGDCLLDRPSPAAADMEKTRPALWRDAQARYQRTSGEEGKWSPARATPPTWTVRCGDLAFELKLTPFGHVGLFPEQAENWDWLARRIRAAQRPFKLLNLFAYTGGGTLAAAAAGAEVVHVDAARNVVAWARRNAALSGLSDAPIRWITDDARRFVKRELRRGVHYDGVVLDPPSYGHGPKGEVWRLAEDLLPLLELCGRLTDGRRTLVLLTCHSPGFGPAELGACLMDGVFSSCQAGATCRPLEITTADGRELPCGVVARWP